MDNIPTWMAVVISVGIAALVALLVQLILVPIQRRKIMGQPVHFNFGGESSGACLLQYYLSSLTWTHSIMI